MPLHGGAQRGRQRVALSYFFRRAAVFCFAGLRAAFAATRLADFFGFLAAIFAGFFGAGFFRTGFFAAPFFAGAASADELLAGLFRWFFRRGDFPGADSTGCFASD
jgi:hypothetical protein